MFKKKKVLIIGVVIVLVILVGTTAGVVLAANPPTLDQGKSQLMARVAQIVGIPQQKLEDAFKQASKELRDQRLDQYLQKQVNDGKITKDQAAKYNQWIKSRPDIPLPGFDKRVRPSLK